MKNMLVTGGCGFIGSNYIRYILEESDFTGRVINLDALTYAGNQENLAGIEEKFKDRYLFVKADICDQEKVDQVFKDYSIDCVCHLAAESHVDRSIVRPDTFIQSNIVGTFNLLEHARKYQDKIELFHHVSTDEVFGSLGKEGFFVEETRYKPNSPYSASKASSDHMVRAFFKTYDLPVTISNCSNNYGPYQFPEKLLPLIIRNADKNDPLPVYGDGKHIRDWLYVRDHCIAIWLIMKEGRKGETYNIGGNNEMENLTVVKMVCDMLDDIQGKVDNKARKELIAFVKDRPGHDRRYAIDFSKLKNELSWIPEESFETGLKKTIHWYLNNSDWVNHVISGEYQNWMKEQYDER